MRVSISVEGRRYTKKDSTCFSPRCTLHSTKSCAEQVFLLAQLGPQQVVNTTIPMQPNTRLGIKTNSTTREMYNNPPIISNGWAETKQGPAWPCKDESKLSGHLSYVQFPDRAQQINEVRIGIRAGTAENPACTRAGACGCAIKTASCIGCGMCCPNACLPTSIATCTA